MKPTTYGEKSLKSWQSLSWIKISNLWWYPNDQYRIHNKLPIEGFSSKF